MELGSRYGPEMERHEDGSLYRMSQSQLKQAVQLIKKNCCNYKSGNCLLLEDEDECICPQRVSYSVCCRWFRNAVLPLDPELEAGIFADAANTPMKRCEKCDAVLSPGSNRKKYCPACAAAVRRQRDRERKQKVCSNSAFRP